MTREQIALMHRVWLYLVNLAESLNDEDDEGLDRLLQDIEHEVPEATL